MMGGLDTPTSGSVIVRGEELAKKNDDELTIFRRRKDVYKRQILCRFLRLFFKKQTYKHKKSANETALSFTHLAN